MYYQGQLSYKVLLFLKEKQPELWIWGQNDRFIKNLIKDHKFDDVLGFFKLRPSEYKYWVIVDLLCEMDKCKQDNHIMLCLKNVCAFLEVVG